MSALPHTFCDKAQVLDILFFFFFNDTATTEIYTLSLHDALPICLGKYKNDQSEIVLNVGELLEADIWSFGGRSSSFEELVKLRSEEHTSELQSQSNLVCRLLLEKKK